MSQKNERSRRAEKNDILYEIPLQIKNLLPSRKKAEATFIQLCSIRAVYAVTARPVRRPRQALRLRALWKQSLVPTHFGAASFSAGGDFYHFCVRCKAAFAPLYTAFPTAPCKIDALFPEPNPRKIDFALVITCGSGSFSCISPLSKGTRRLPLRCLFEIRRNCRGRFALCLRHG